jgi:hypothetical protein
VALLLGVFVAAKAVLSGLPHRIQTFEDSPLTLGLLYCLLNSQYLHLIIDFNPVMDMRFHLVPQATHSSSQVAGGILLRFAPTLSSHIDSRFHLFYNIETINNADLLSRNGKLFSAHHSRSSE